MKVYKNNYEYYDEIGKESFKQWCSYQYWCSFNRKSKPGYAKWDVSYISGDSKSNISIIGEIKIRKGNKSSDYSNWFLEVDKYESLKLIKESSTKETYIHYINIYEDNTIQIWNITDLKHLISTKRYMNKQTMGNDTKIEKNVYLLDNKDVIFKGNFNIEDIKEEQNYITDYNNKLKDLYENY